MGMFDDQVVAFACPKCGLEFNKTIAWLENTASMVCDGCGVTIELDTEHLSETKNEVIEKLAEDHSD